MSSHLISAFCITLIYLLGSQMNRTFSPDGVLYEPEGTADNIVYAWFEIYKYSDHDGVTPSDLENKSYLERIGAWEYGAWEYAGPTGLERGLEMMKFVNPKER